MVAAALGAGTGAVMTRRLQWIAALPWGALASVMSPATMRASWGQTPPPSCSSMAVNAATGWGDGASAVAGNAAVAQAIAPGCQTGEDEDGG